MLVDPMASDSKVSISVASLPCIACQANFTMNAGALTSDIASVDEQNQEGKYKH
jgi:hypothetical protein